MKTLLLTIMTLITLQTQAQEASSTEPTQKQEQTKTETMLTVSIPMMGTITLKAKDEKTAENLAPFIEKESSKRIENESAEKEIFASVRHNK